MRQATLGSQFWRSMRDLAAPLMGLRTAWADTILSIYNAKFSFMDRNWRRWARRIGAAVNAVCKSGILNGALEHHAMPVTCDMLISSHLFSYMSFFHV